MLSFYSIALTNIKYMLLYKNAKKNHHKLTLQKKVLCGFHIKNTYTWPQLCFITLQLLLSNYFFYLSRHSSSEDFYSYKLILKQTDNWHENNNNQMYDIHNDKKVQFPFKSLIWWQQVAIVHSYKENVQI